MIASKSYDVFLAPTEVASDVWHDKIAPYARRSCIFPDLQSPRGAICI